MSDENPARPWQDIVAAYSRELDPAKLKELSEELDHSLEERAKKRTQLSPKPKVRELFDDSGFLRLGKRCYLVALVSRSMAVYCSCLPAQQGPYMLPQCEFHGGFYLLEAGRLYGDGGILSAAVPAVVTEPKLTFDAQARRHLKDYSMVCHR